MEDLIKTKPYKDITLEFDTSRHMFFANGEKLPSVTHFTGIIDKSRPRMFWQEKLKREDLISKWKRSEGRLTLQDITESTALHRVRKEEAASIGTLAHDWAENFSKGIKQPMPTIKEVKNAVLGFLKWIEEEGFKLTPKGSERHILSKKYWYAGIVDAEGTRKEKLAVIDYKTSSGIYEEMMFQTAGYQQALQEMTGKKYDERWIVRFDKKTGDFEPYLCGPFEKDIKGFLGCREIVLRIDEIKNQKS